MTEYTYSADGKFRTDSLGNVSRNIGGVWSGMQYGGYTPAAPGSPVAIGGSDAPRPDNPRRREPRQEPERVETVRIQGQGTDAEELSAWEAAIAAAMNAQVDGPTPYTVGNVNAPTAAQNAPAPASNPGINPLVGLILGAGMFLL